MGSGDEHSPGAGRRLRESDGVGLALGQLKGLNGPELTAIVGCLEFHLAWPIRIPGDQTQ
jgi:hypothetical protein